MKAELGILTSDVNWFMTLQVHKSMLQSEYECTVWKIRCHLNFECLSAHTK